MSSFQTLADLKSFCLERLAKAVGNLSDPMRTPVLGNVGEEQAELRTIVLRDVDVEQGALLAYSDWRAPKVRQLLKAPQGTWLFYDPSDQTQFRIGTRIEILHRNDYTCEVWKELPESNRGNYLTTLPPGRMQAADVSVEYSEEMKDGSQFAILRATIHTIESLQLAKDGNHQRWLADLDRGSLLRLVP